MRDWQRRAALVLVVAAIAAVQQTGSTDGALRQHLYPHLYYLPILAAALRDGWRGGLVFAALSGAAYFTSDPSSGRYVEFATFCLAAGLAGVYADRERREKRRYRELAEKLSGVYETLQANFEGMKRAERLSAIGHLSAGLAHEIRNPLASISGAASILGRRLPASDETLARCVHIIDTECRRLNGLLTNFLNFARPRSPSFQQTDVRALLQDVIQLAEHALAKKRITFRQRVEAEAADVECDPDQLRQVLLNLLINAIEASPDGATVTLGVHSEEGKIAIRVVDEGSGVAPEDIEKLFDPFFTTKESGTGLGLSVAHQIVGHMGGQLAARRNAGGGMTFSVALPVRKQNGAEENTDSGR